MTKIRRCPLHPTGCTRHENPNPPRSTRRISIPTETRVLALRGSFNRYIVVRTAQGSGNPAKRRRRILRLDWLEGGST